jgi:hypothetical protein
MFATPNDLARFLRGLLNNELLSATDLQKWLKPGSLTSSTENEAVGMPWTIRRPTNLGLESGVRPVDIYTMPGGQGYVSTDSLYDVYWYDQVSLGKKLPRVSLLNLHSPRLLLLWSSY